MKRLKQILLLSITILIGLPQASNAQFRIGFEGTVGAQGINIYDRNGFLLKERSFENGMYIWGLNTGIITETLLTSRHSALKNFPISLRIGSFFSWYRDQSIEPDFNSPNFYEECPTLGEALGIAFSTGLEIKYLISNNWRLYLNADYIMGYNAQRSKYDDTYYESAFIHGYKYGAGIEYKNIRFGYANQNLLRNIHDYSEDYEYESVGNKMHNVHSFSITVWFNGNHFYKKKSIIKVY